MNGFRGTYTVMITPFDDAGGLDLPGLQRFVNWQITQGIHGLVALGSTREFLSLSDEEHEAVAATAIEAAAGRVPVLIGTGADDTRKAVRLSRRAERLGADRVMIIPPFYCTPTEDELFHQYRTISEAIGIPIMLYNNPAMANVDMKPNMIARLSAIDNCRYVKETTLDVTRVRDIIRLCSETMGVFGGILGFESFVEGACGWIAVAADVAPNALAQLFRLVVDDENLIDARRLCRRYTRLIEFVGGQRPPRLTLPAAENATAQAIVRELGLSA
jgi:4-hydroxy-tetrahydrodipicolinate synthase